MHFTYSVFQIIGGFYTIPKYLYVFTWLVKLNGWVVYLCIWDIMNFKSRVNDLLDSWKEYWNLGILAEKKEVVWSLAGKHLSVFSVKGKVEVGRWGGVFGVGKDSRKEQPWVRLDHGLATHSILVEPINFSYWFHLVSLVP